VSNSPPRVQSLAGAFGRGVTYFTYICIPPPQIRPIAEGRGGVTPRVASLSWQATRTSSPRCEIFNLLEPPSDKAKREVAGSAKCNTTVRPARTSARGALSIGTQSISQKREKIATARSLCSNFRKLSSLILIIYNYTYNYPYLSLFSRSRYEIVSGRALVPVARLLYSRKK